MRGLHWIICAVLCYGQASSHGIGSLSEKIGNFSIEILFHTAKVLPHGQNMIISPFTIWTTLAVLAEGATRTTRDELNHALRLQAKGKDATRMEYGEITQLLRMNTTTVELSKFNGIFVDIHRLPLQDFQDKIKKFYDTDMVVMDFQDNEKAASLLNTAISDFTHGKIPKIVESGFFKDAQMVLTSALYFKGQWGVKFNKESTLKEPFYDGNGRKIGEVNMMYNRFTFPFAKIGALEAKVIELPYSDGRLSMIMMLPEPGVSLENMFLNFQKVTLDSLLGMLKVSRDQYPDDAVDCFIPRFKIESSIELTEILKKKMGIAALFDSNNATLPYVSRTPLYVSKMYHKAVIEVSEDGTTAAAITSAELANRIGVPRFKADRPFTYMIVEKFTNTIIFGGFYEQPSLY